MKLQVVDCAGECGGDGGDAGDVGDGGSASDAHDAQVARQPTRSLVEREEPNRPFSLRLLQLAVH